MGLTTFMVSASLITFYKIKRLGHQLELTSKVGEQRVADTVDLIAGGREIRIVVDDLPPHMRYKLALETIRIRRHKQAFIFIFIIVTTATSIVSIATVYSFTIASGAVPQRTVQAVERFLGLPSFPINREHLPIKKSERLPAENEGRPPDQGSFSGPLKITLTWNTWQDLDLSAKFSCDSEENTISFVNISACGGNLDHDANYMNKNLYASETISWLDASGINYPLQIAISTASGGSSDYSLEIEGSNWSADRLGTINSPDRVICWLSAHPLGAHLSSGITCASDGQ